MKKRLATLVALWLPMFATLSAMAADPMSKPDGTAVTEQPKETPGGNPIKPVAKKETKPDAGKAKPVVINTEAELETDCNNQ